MTSIRSMMVGVLLATLLTLAGSLPRARADEEIYNKALPSATWIISPKGNGKDNSGSGVLIDARQRLVLTAYHVVEDRADAIVFFPVRNARGELITDPDQYVRNADKLGLKGRIIATDASHDLALVKLPRVPSGATAVALAGKSVEAGQKVFAIGNSGVSDGVLWRYIDGSVRQVYTKKLTYETKQKVDARVVEMTVPTNGGDSGGPILNAKGELVAITAASRENQNAVHFGIDIKEIWTLIGTHLPAAKMTDIRIEQNVERDGLKGLSVHCTIEVERAKGLPCDVVLDFCNAKMETLKKPAVGLPEKSVALLYSNRITPSHEGALSEDISFFMPYETIKASIPQAVGPRFEPAGTLVNEKAVIVIVANVLEVGSKRWILPASKGATFEFNPALGIPIPAKLPMPE